MLTVSKKLGAPPCAGAIVTLPCRMADRPRAWYREGRAVGSVGERRPVADGDEAGPEERMAQARPSCHVELRLPQGLGPAFAREHAPVVRGHEVARRIVRDLPEAH